jgi:hypothetical protein
MHKLKLDLDHLTVESFETNAANGAQRGTVRALAPSPPLITAGSTCPVSCEPTCDYSIGGTCDASCGDTCGGTCGETCNCSGNSCYATCFGTCNVTCDTCQTNCQQESCVFHCP